MSSLRAHPFHLESIPAARVRRDSHLALVALLMAFVLLAAAYSIVVPIFEGPDEDDHFRLIKYLADQRALPVQLFQPGGGEAGHQGWQPPFYYALTALVISQVNTADFEQHLWRNPAASFQGERACCGRNFYFHTDSENFPYSGATLAIHLARGVSILFGMLTVATIYALVRTLFPAPKWLALTAAAVAGFNPSFLFASALVSNDVPLAALCSLALLLSIKLLYGDYAPNLRNFALLGIALALALLVKTTALGLVPLALAVAVWVAWQNRAGARLNIFAKALVGIVAPVMALTGWWFARNQMLYGDPLAYRLIYTSAIFPREQPLTAAELFRINLPWMWQTFWGGPTPGDFPPALLFVLGGLVLLAMVGFIRGVLSRRWTRQMPALTLLAAWCGFILVAQIQFIRTSGGTDQGRYLFPAIASLALLFVLGSNEIADALARYFRRASRAHTLAISTGALMFALALFALFGLTLPAYARPPQFDESQIQGARVNFNFNNELALRGFLLSARSVSCGGTLEVTLYWNALAPMKVSYRTFVHLEQEGGAVAGVKDVVPYGGAYPTVLWKPREWVPDTIHLSLNRGARAGLYNVVVGVYPFGQPENRVNLVSSDEDAAVLDSVQVYAPAGGCA